MPYYPNSLQSKTQTAKIPQAHTASCITENHFGPGSLKLLGKSMKHHGLSKAMIVTDTGIIQTGILEQVKNELDNFSIRTVVFDAVQPNPTSEIVTAGAAFLQKIKPDSIIAIGGGSPIDTAKAINILAANGGRIEDYEGVDKSSHRGLFLAAVPTTAGTGSETTSFYVITDTERHSKMVMVDTNCLVDLAVIDPELMLGMPPSLTAATGMDAMTHAIEAVLSVRSNPLSDRDALFAIKEIRTALPDAFAKGQNLDARTRMAYAQYSAGQAFSNAGLGLVHAMAHALGGHFNLPHGLCNAMLLPHVLNWLGSHQTVHRHFKPIAQALEIRGAEWMVPLRCAQEVVRDISGLNRKLNIPAKLAPLGVTAESLPMLADLVLQDTCLPDSPVQPMRDEIIRLYKQAL